MGQFDYETFIRLTGDGDIVTSIPTAMGMPSCMVDLVRRGAMKYIPTSILQDMSEPIDAAIEGTRSVMATIINNSIGKTGLIEFDEASGKFVFLSEESIHGAKGDDNSFNRGLGGFLGAITSLTAGASELYDNYENFKEQAEAIKGCFDAYKAIRDHHRGESHGDGFGGEGGSEAHFEQRLGPLRTRLRKSEDQLDKFLSLKNEIEETLNNRDKGIEEDPVFLDKFEEFLKGTYLEDTLRKNISEKEEKEELIRLVFGPPKSKKGQFLLSVDGLYYDSQTPDLKYPGGPFRYLVRILNELHFRKKGLKKEHLWEFGHDPNLGGKGIQISSEALKSYIDTLFDPNIIDDSKGITQKHYNTDHFLKTLIGHKEARILDLSANISELETGDAGAAIIVNMKQALLSEISTHDKKINKRKKQLEIADKAHQLFGLKGSGPEPGHVPINDFSYLADVNLAVDIEKQRRLVFDQDDVSGVVRPLIPEYVASPVDQNVTTIEHLMVPEVGVGGLLSTASSVSATDGAKLAITSPVATQGLFAIYNFLNSDVTVTPSSAPIDKLKNNKKTYNVLNCVTADNYNNAQLVGSHASAVWVSGLGIPYLKGIPDLKHAANYTLNSDISGVGSYVRLPNTKEFQNWTYSPGGFAFETWAHLPSLSSVTNGWGDNSLDVSSHYRLLLSCENTGIASSVEPQKDVNRLTPDFGAGITRGMMIGFTTDRRIAQGKDPSNNRKDNYPTSSLSFFVAPTQSKDSTSVGFLSDIKQGVCASSAGWHSFAMNTSATGENGVAFSSICSSFMLISVSVDIVKDKVDVFLNGNLMGTSSVNAVFGIPKGTSVNLPSFARRNSFEYSAITVNSDAPAEFKPGPKFKHDVDLDPKQIGFQNFTPWILGGGWTDGLNTSGDTGGNFMGSDYGGKRSGLDGFIGSTKFYSNSIGKSEAVKNYEGQKDFFENIRISGDCL